MHVFIQTLTTLDLSWNHIGGKGAECVATALGDNTVSFILCPFKRYSCLWFCTQTLDAPTVMVKQFGRKLKRELYRVINWN